MACPSSCNDLGHGALGTRQSWAASGGWLVAHADRLGERELPAPQRKCFDDMLLRAGRWGAFLTCRPSHRVARNLAQVRLYSEGEDFGAWRGPARSFDVLIHLEGNKIVSRPAYNTLRSSTSLEAMASYEDYLRVALIAAKEAGGDLQSRQILAACRDACVGIKIMTEYIMARICVQAR